MNFTTNDNFDKDEYIKSIENVNLFVELYNKRFDNLKAISQDSKDRFAPDILLMLDGERYGYIELESGTIHNNIWIFERRLKKINKKQYDLPTLFIKHDLNTHECRSIKIEDLKFYCMMANQVKRERLTPNGLLPETAFIIPKHKFNHFKLVDAENQWTKPLDNQQ